MDPEPAVDHRGGIAARPDLAGARCVMAPGVVLDERAQLLRRLHGRAGEDLRGDEVATAPCDLPHGLQALHHSGEIAPAVGALVEVMEVDLRDIAWVAGAQ